MRWLIDLLTVANVVVYWGIVMVGEFWVKRKWPHIVKEYVVGMQGKFIVVQGVSLVVMVGVMAVTRVGVVGGVVE